jgi:WD40 repeat protein
MEKEPLFTSNPENIEFHKFIAEDLENQYNLDNLFCIFKNSAGTYLVYSQPDNTIISYDLINNKVVNEKKNAHESYISNFRYQNLDGKDVIMSISGWDNNLKLWDFNNWECILNLKGVNKECELKSACFVTDKGQSYIATSNAGHAEIHNLEALEQIKIFDLKGNKVKEINDSKDNTFLIDTFHDDKTSKTYLVTGNWANLKSYDFNEGKLFHLYKESEGKTHFSMAIFKDGDVNKLISSSFDSHVRIWNFNTGELLKTIKAYDDFIYGICLWNSKYLFVGTLKKEVLLVNLDEGKVVKTIKQNSALNLTLKKANIPDLGDCLFIKNLNEICLLKLNA